MEIEIIPLALKKIVQRNVTIELVRETIESPHQIVKGYGGRGVRQRKYQDGGKEKLLRVVCEEEVDKIVVITAYFTTQIERYWEGRI